MLEPPASPPATNGAPTTQSSEANEPNESNEPSEASDNAPAPPKVLAAKQRKREKDRIRAQQKRQLLQEQTDELKILKEQFSGVSDTLNIIKEIMGADTTDVATQIRTMASIVSNARGLIEALPHNSELRRPITKWLIRSLNPSEACRIFGLSRAAYYRAYHSKEEKLMANASGYHHQHRRTYNPPDPNATAAAIAAAVAMIHQPNEDPGSPDSSDEAPLSPNSMRASSIAMQSSLSHLYQQSTPEGQALSFPHLQQLQPLSMPMQSQSPISQRQHQHQPHVHSHNQLPHQPTQSPRHIPHHFQPQSQPRSSQSSHNVSPPHPSQQNAQQSQQSHHQSHPSHPSHSPHSSHPHATHTTHAQHPSQHQPQSTPQHLQGGQHLHSQGSHRQPEEQPQRNDDNMPSLLSVVAEAGAQTLEQQQQAQAESHKRQRTM